MLSGDISCKEPRKGVSEGLLMAECRLCPRVMDPQCRRYPWRQTAGNPLDDDTRERERCVCVFVPNNPAGY